MAGVSSVPIVYSLPAPGKDGANQKVPSRNHLRISPPAGDILAHRLDRQIDPEGIQGSPCEFLLGASILVSFILPYYLWKEHGAAFGRLIGMFFPIFLTISTEYFFTDQDLSICNDTSTTIFV